MRKTIATLAVAASVAGGGVAGALIGVPALSGAQSSDSSSSTTAPPANGTAPAPAGPIEKALKGLVDNGTITQQQADAVRNAIKDETGKMPRHGPRGPVGPAGVLPMHGAKLKVAADALGMSEADLRTQLESGKTLAQVAQDKGVDVNKVIDALVADAAKSIDQAVTDGKLTQQQADTFKSTLKDRVTQMVNSAKPKAGRHGGTHGPGMMPGGNTGNGSGSTTTPSTGATPQSYNTTA